MKITFYLPNENRSLEVSSLFKLTRSNQMQTPFVKKITLKKNNSVNKRKNWFNSYSFL